ncbi:MAG: RsmB/NOP family class I SAM-dependent RNA methyltransferase [Ignavibacteriales bacterium]|nr:RsmB/NOP family class I SAM-dependent RNA methyltransferase [Ignavibacteriaceae bacterium]MCZ2143119.1 RsmB/NOP family class I SAM-dependent RNA methyltransferase [Ignavibacteriales bacterium]WKZ72552.1 MAG: RsmB/NOP family class I SAM-dependent RNA methyltransferase [Ignavibacteriaceae bacterium]
MPKVHKNLITAIINCVEGTLRDGRYAEGVINYVLKSNPKWGARDRSFIAGAAYDTIRNLRLYAYAVSVENSAPFVSGYPLISSEDINKTVYSRLFLNGFIDKDTLEDLKLNPDEVSQRFEAGKKIRKIRESVPDWLDELGTKELGARWSAELAALNQKAKVVLRINRLKISREGVVKKLNELGIFTETLPGYPDALILKERKNISNLQEYKNGYFEIQDASSQLVAPFTGVKSGMRVIDACAGAGGKSLHLAALMGNKGRIISLDIEAKKLDELKKRSKRNGAEIIERRLIDSRKVIKRLKESADLVLLDAPCSGLGVLRRNMDAKWRLQPERIEELKKLQWEILSDYSSMVKPGGKLVYVTCSILPSENGRQTERFLKEYGYNFRLEEEQNISPADSGFDGFYLARFMRNS